MTVAQYAAPTEREKRHHFLWRFSPSLPGWGGMCIYDRTWYGRVLVERVEGFASEQQWERAYGEIVDYERGLAAEGMVIVKFWLHLSPKEQLKRFKDRERDPLRRWKLTDEDWRNRDRRPDYERAVTEMLRRTDHPRRALVRDRRREQAVRAGRGRQDGQRGDGAGSARRRDRADDARQRPVTPPAGIGTRLTFEAPPCAS